MSEEEFGLPRDWAIMLPCDAVCIDYTLSLIKRGLAWDLEQALLFSIVSPTRNSSKWQGNCRSLLPRGQRISFPRNNRDANVGSCSTSSVADKGHYVVYTAGQRRFMIPLVYLNNEIVRELFKLSEEEFGLPSDGPITLPCDSVFMEYVILLIQRGVAINLEKALLATVSSLSSFHRAHANQELLVYRFNHTVAF
ncbi:SAUR-like auxin-responsive protein family [Actinidia rufa]|uniref:SAUR-like auxin-responsive protein family n=1 Tax=Actinidia rufa TaxID=165716 RepID=A0A7J0FAY1_9ERIC|nr:SAUR-like auxin-responsive protein family [Actinidia rufa]